MKARVKEWLRMVRGGETLTVEFKQQIPKLHRLARSFSAFSNSGGGTIFFGVEDNGEIRGLVHLQGTEDLVNQVAQFHCDPPVHPETQVWPIPGGNPVLVVEIPEAAQKPVFAVNPKDPKDAWPYFRSESENLPLDKKSMKTMRRRPAVSVESDLRGLDRHAVNMLNYLDDHPRSTVGQMAKTTNISTTRAKKIVVHLERNGWIHGFFNEKRREYSLAIPWRKR